MIFPIIHQHDSMQCGIACLQMVCKYFGREYSLDSLSKLCFATAEGVSLLGINEAANTLGLHTTCARATTMVLGEIPLPCILHWNQNHFVVLYKVKKGKNFYVADPGKGLVVYTLEEFKQQVCEEISQVLRANHLGLDSRKPFAACPAVPHSVHRGCWHQKPRHWLCLAYIVGTANANN